MIFLHVFKTGGTTLRRILYREFDRSAVWIVDHERQEESRREFQAIADEQKQRIRVIMGHMAFGFHEVVASQSSYVTLLRHPVDRIISHYYYVLRQGPAHRLYDAIARHKMTVGDYALGGLAKELDNGQTRMLSATEESIPIGEMSHEQLMVAQSNLRGFFSVVGVLDSFDEFVLMLKHRFDLKNVYYIKRNVGRGRQDLGSVLPHDRSKIERANQLDMELYASAKRMSNERIRELGPQFQATVRRFRTQRVWRALLREATRRLRSKLLKR